MKAHNISGIYNKHNEMDTHEPSTGVYTIGVASRMLGIPVTIIREYEAWGLVRPCVTATQRRMFSDIDIQIMRELRKLQKDFHLNLASLRFLAGCLPCWILKPCSLRDRKSCQVPFRTGVPCWECEDAVCKPTCEDCRSCRVYRSLANLSSLKQVLREALINFEGVVRDFVLEEV